MADDEQPVDERASAGGSSAFEGSQVDSRAADPGSQVMAAPERVGLAPVTGTSLAGTDRTPIVANNQPVQIVLDPRMMQPVTVPPSMRWSLGQAFQVLAIAAVVAAIGVTAGFLFGGTRPVERTARSEFIYFLEDAVPDGFLREDRRILTQLVTIESETLLGPVAQEFDVTTRDLRKDLKVEVIDLSEVIRLDVQHVDPARALAINDRVLNGYQNLVAGTDRLIDQGEMRQRRDTILADLAAADEEALALDDVELADVALQADEESLTREIETINAQVQRLAGLSDDLLSTPGIVDDRSSLNGQVATAKGRLRQLEAEVLAIRSERAELQRIIERQLATETPYTAAENQQRVVVLGAREESVSLELDTVSQRIINLERTLVETSLSTPTQPSSGPIDQRLAEARSALGELEAQVLVIRTRRAELAQSASAKPSLVRRVDRLEQDLTALDAEIAAAQLLEDRPSPIEVLTEPVVLDEPSNNPKLIWSALGLLASLPIAAIAAAAIRQRQRKRA